MPNMYYIDVTLKVMAEDAEQAFILAHEAIRGSDEMKCQVVVKEISEPEPAS